LAKYRKCNLYYEDSPNYLVQYKGKFKEQIDKVSYACGDVITDILAVISVRDENFNQLLKDVPSIKYVDPRMMFVLQDISPTSVDNINAIKINPYLGLNGSGVLIGMVDTGIDYLNDEFIREDDTSRVLEIWDQTVSSQNNSDEYIGQKYNNQQINNAIKAYRNKEDPYKIVPSKDENGHGTKIAGIIGGRGATKEFQGVANQSDFVIVKLLESLSFKRILQQNGVPYTPIFNNAEVLAAIEYLKDYSLNVKRPMVIFIGVGASEGSHDGNNLLSKYITSIGTIRGLVTVSGVGNEGEAEGHASGRIKAVSDQARVELNISKEMKYLSFSIWVFKPNRASLKVITPTGEESEYLKVESGKTREIDFVFINTKMYITYEAPEHFTGHQVIRVTFDSIKVGIWTLVLTGEYIINGIYHIWLPSFKTLPEGTRFLQSDPEVTLTVPSTARKVVTVAYSKGYENAIVPASGKGYNSNGLINPDITAIGVNVLTTKVGGGVTVDSGSSVAAGILAGACALLLQWGIVQRNDTTMYSIKIRSYLIYGADRSNLSYKYPSKEIGYGLFDLLGTFNVISRGYRNNKSTTENYIEYYIRELFVRIPI
jgi:subtilisin family serine protease